MKKQTNPVVLIIRDGWGFNKKRSNNAIKLASTPYTDFLMQRYPNILINTSGDAVGIPKGYQGNSEVGHLTIGSGRIINQSLARINSSIKNKSFFKNKAFLKAINNCKKHDSALHLKGLVQDQGVHAHINHLFALLEIAKKHKLKKVYIHFFSDGRDTPEKSAIKFLKQLKNKVKKLKINARIATVCGRYYAMDRDSRWKRTELAYKAISLGKGRFHANNAKHAILNAYNRGETDEFIKPTVIADYKGVKDNDSIIFFNYRFDRARELATSFVKSSFSHFKTLNKKICFTAMTEFYKGINAEVAFVPERINNFLGEVLSKKNIPQLRISETEKYAHVTFFFNAEIEQPFPKEKRILIPSPKISTYDKQPEMSVYKITKRLIKALKSNKYKVIIANLVNGDMVGHTGKLGAAIKAVEAVDKCIGKITIETLKLGGSLIITADHGNCEEMYGSHKTTHTLNPVPLILIHQDKKIKLRKAGLYDIAPTILKILKIKKPREMTGRCLF